MIIFFFSLFLLKLLGLVVLVGWLLAHGGVTITLSLGEALAAVVYAAFLTVMAILGCAWLENVR